MFAMIQMFIRVCIMYLNDICLLELSTLNVALRHILYILLATSTSAFPLMPAMTLLRSC